MSYINRILDLDVILAEKSCFLFGARQSGKSSYIKRQLKTPFFKTYNLLDQGLYIKLINDPTRIRQELAAENMSDTLVVIDEIQRIPALLHEVHLLIEEHNIRFLLTGSSCRKIKQAGVNLLGGRARNKTLHPLTYIELKEKGFDLQHAMHFGLLPSHYLSKNPGEDIDSYVGRYLTEEIAAESLVRHIPSFGRFLEVAATCNTQLINFTSIASDAKVTRQTVQNYFQILQDTLIATELNAYTATVKRKAIETSKFYFFDMGIVNHLRRIGPIKKESKDFGEFFEHFIFTELRAYLDYFHPLKKLYFWRSKSGFEVDFLIDNDIAIEVKSSENISHKHLSGLLALKEENLVKKYIVISDEKTKRKDKDITVYPWRIFLDELWAGEII